MQSSLEETPLYGVDPEMKSLNIICVNDVCLKTKWYKLNLLCLVVLLLVVLLATLTSLSFKKTWLVPLLHDRKRCFYRHWYGYGVKLCTASSPLKSLWLLLFCNSQPRHSTFLFRFFTFLSDICLHQWSFIFAMFLWL